MWEIVSYEWEIGADGWFLRMFDDQSKYNPCECWWYIVRERIVASTKQNSIAHPQYTFNYLTENKSSIKKKKKK